MRICFGLSQTLVDVEAAGLDFSLTIRPGASDLLLALKELGHVLILWTSKNKRSLKLLSHKSSEFFSLFDEIYTKEDFELLQNIPGCSIHLFKNIDQIEADCMIESKCSYKKYANSLHLADKYLIVPVFREFFLNEPTKQQIKMVGNGIVARQKIRQQEKENWALEVFDFIENLKRVSTEVTQDNIVL